MTLPPNLFPRKSAGLRRIGLFLLFCLAACLPAQAGSFSRVVIDPGHGGHDMGGHFGYLYEKHLALDVSFRLQRYLSKKGIKSTLTRERDVFIPLEDRPAVSNRMGNCVFVSIHFNYVSYSGPAGTETFYNNAEGQKLAAQIQGLIASGLGTPNRGVKFARFKVLRASKMPAALVEGGFISTGNDRSRVLDPRYRQRLAELIGDGILRYRRM
jgi:N-acetylmuramoyl-L-alanine amidase